MAFMAFGLVWTDRADSPRAMPRQERLDICGLVYHAMARGIEEAVQDDQIRARLRDDERRPLGRKAQDVAICGYTRW